MKKPRTIKDLIEILEPIPAEQWCVDARINKNGQHCVLGHLDAALGRTRAFCGCDNIIQPIIGCDIRSLAAVNNGSPNMDHYRQRKPDTRTDGFAVRKRVLGFLYGLLKKEKS